MHLTEKLNFCDLKRNIVHRKFRKLRIFTLDTFICLLPRSGIIWLNLGFSKFLPSEISLWKFLENTSFQTIYKTTWTTIWTYDLFYFSENSFSKIGFRIRRKLLILLQAEYCACDIRHNNDELIDAIFRFWLNIPCMFLCVFMKSAIGCVWAADYCSVDMRTSCLSTLMHRDIEWSRQAQAVLIYLFV